MTTFDQPKEAGFNALQEAVIRQACADYLYCLAFGFAPYSTMKQINTYECEQFFKSPWFTALAPTSIDGDAVITAMKKAAKLVRESVHRSRRCRGGWEIYDKNEPKKDLGLGVFDTLDAANKRCAELDCLQQWQYAIAVYGRPKRNRG